MSIIKYGALLVVATAGFAGSAHATSSLTATGTITPVCQVDVTPRAFDPEKTTIQNIAGVEVTCNKPGTKTLSVTGTNGHFHGPQQVDYLMTLDLDGGLLPFNNVNLLPSTPVNSGIGAPDANVAAGLPGDFSITLLSKPYLAGTYTETWNMTVG